MKNTLHYEFAYSSPYGLKEDIKDKIAESAEPSEEIITQEKSQFSWCWLAELYYPAICHCSSSSPDCFGLTT